MLFHICRELEVGEINDVKNRLDVPISRENGYVGPTPSQERIINRNTNTTLPKKQVPSYGIEEINGRHEETRTPDLYRVKVAL